MIVRVEPMEINAENPCQYFQEDGFHPNELGAELIANKLAEQIEN